MTTPLLAGAEAAMLWREVSTTTPLATSLLWDQSKPRTSQRRPLQDAGQDATLAAGGNGAGKTELGAQAAVAVACGRDDPAVQAWISANGVDPRLIPPKGGTVLASSLNSALSIHVQREAVKRYLPAGAVWRNPSGAGVSVAQIPNGGKIVFITNDAGARAFQGYAAAMVWLDEEHDEPVYNEALQRVSRWTWEGRSGWLLLTMTPLKGLTWVYRRFIAEPDTGTKAHYIHGGDNPFIDQVKRARLLGSYGDHERAARDRGEFTSLEGLVYPFRRDLHVVAAFTPPQEWERYAGIDFGTRNPFACVLAALDPADDTLHLLRAHYQTEWTLSQHAAALRKMWQGQPPAMVVADPEDRAARLALAREHGIVTVPAKKGRGSVRAGINTVAERLAPDVEGRPHLLVHDHPSLRPVVREFMSYRWDTKNSKADQPDRPLKKDDHAMDAVRYLVSAINRSGFAAG